MSSIFYFYIIYVRIEMEAENAEIQRIGVGDEIEKRHPMAYFVFGRFQPPTIGHGRLLMKIAERATTEDGIGDGYIFVSSTKNKQCAENKKELAEANDDAVTNFTLCKSNENPLDVSTKIYYLKRMFPELPLRFINTEIKACNSPFAAVALLLKTYDRICMVVGSDRVKCFSGKFGENANIVGISRDMDSAANTVEAMSGTKMRKAAVALDFDTFRGGVINLSNEEIMELMFKVRHGINMFNDRKSFNPV